MSTKRLVWQLLPSYLGVCILLLLLVGWLSIDSIRSHARSQRADDLRISTNLIGREISKLLSNEQRELLQAYCQNLRSEFKLRCTVVKADGTVIADSDGKPEAMENHAQRTEIRQALQLGSGSSTRYSSTLGKELLYDAIRITDRLGEPFVIRTSIGLIETDTQLRPLYLRLLPGLLGALLVTTAVSILIARRISHPLEEMRAGALQFASGNLSQRLSVPKSLELSQLASAMNEMAAQLDEKLKAVIDQRNELEAVLTSMTEGVIALDLNLRVVTINHAALKLLDLGVTQTSGRHINELIRSTKLQDLISTCLSEQQPQEAEVILRSESELYFGVYVRPLLSAKGTCTGLLIVLHDRTRIRKLETMRQDFVANVSHELKTPITSIKGFVETLLDGAQNDPSSRERFLQVILRHADRLNAIIDDLMTLTKLEHGEKSDQIEMQPEELRHVLTYALSVNSVKSKEKGLQIDTSGTDKLKVVMNAALVEQALTNLIDNAIKYSPAHSLIEIKSYRENGSACISIKDQGPGIEAQHLPRLFERFYRVDRARSRDAGGTGLGLALVKHIAQVHGGSVSVESYPGKGSTFTLRLPL